jgi:hypothetical protein
MGREGRGAERSWRERVRESDEGRANPTDTVLMGASRMGKSIDLGVLIAVETKLTQDSLTVRQRRRPGTGECHDESNQVRGRCGSMRRRMRSVPCLH